MYRVQIIDQNPSKMHLFSWDLRVAGLLFSQPVFCGRGLPRCYSGNPVWAELPCPLWRGMGSVGTSFLGLLFSGGFPWWLSASLPRVRAEETVSNPLPQSREIAVCSSVSSPGHTISVSVCAAINCSVLGCAPLRSAPSPASRSGHVSALCASKTASRSQFARGNPPLWVSALGAALKSFPCHYRSSSLCPIPSKRGCRSPVV